MTDRELLENAAKAAGLLSQGDETSRFGQFMGLSIREDDNPSGYCWNPLTDDGDALRLAVKLRIDLYFGRRGSVLAISHKGAVYDEQESADPYAATRRAIVRAAAAIGAAK